MKRILILLSCVSALFSFNSCGKITGLIDGVIKNFNMGEDVIFIESATYETTSFQGVSTDVAKFTFTGKNNSADNPVNMSIMFPAAYLSADIPAGELIYQATNGGSSLSILTGEAITFGGGLSGRFDNEMLEKASVEGSVSVKHVDEKWTIASNGFEIVFPNGITYNLDFNYVGEVKELK